MKRPIPSPLKKRATAGPLLLLAALILTLPGASTAAAAPDPAPGPAPGGTPADSAFRYPGVPPEHVRLRRLLNNAFGYANPAHGLIDPVSGYPVEGWNQEPERGLFLRSFTQLTAIGAWVELLANVAAGQADNPYVSRDAALDGLGRAVGSLLADQRNPELGAKGLLVNFLGLTPDGRQGPLLESVEREAFDRTFGAAEGTAIWRALIDQGWIQEEDQGRRGRVRRSETYGANHFDGPLAPHADPARIAAIMDLLDRRAITVVFGDNANLTAALARAAGALLRPDVREDPRAVSARAGIERFIAAQRDGYAHLVDPAAGTLVFGWDVGSDRFMGWDDGHGRWVTGQMNYLVNEFRGPWTFVTLRYGLPLSVLRNAGFRIKPYRRADGREVHALAAWDGSAFQLLGLSLFMQEHRNPGWRRSLETLADSLLDVSRREGLPGLLSEAYSGRGVEYTGDIGLSELAVADKRLIRDAPSLYALGVAYSLAPDKVEAFLGDHWTRIQALFTDHGPWEGWNLGSGRIVPQQTTAHTLSLILGGIGTAQENMGRYLAAHGLAAPLAALLAPGEAANLLEAGNRVQAWTSDPTSVGFDRGAGEVRFAATLSAHGNGGLVLGPPEGETFNLSNGRLRLRFQSETGARDAVIAFRRAANDPMPPPAFPVEIQAPLERTQEGLIEIDLPAAPVLTGIGEIALTFRAGGAPTPVKVRLLGFEFLPFEAALEAVDGGEATDRR